MQLELITKNCPNLHLFGEGPHLNFYPPQAKHRHQPFQPHKPLTKISNHYLSEILYDFTLRLPFSKLHIGGQKMTTRNEQIALFQCVRLNFFPVIISHGPGNIQLIDIRRNRSGEHVPGNHPCLLHFFREAFHRKKWRMKSLEICTLQANYLESKWYNFKGSLECIEVAPATFQVMCLQTYTLQIQRIFDSICAIFAPSRIQSRGFLSLAHWHFHRTKKELKVTLANGKCLPLLIQPTP